MTAILQSQRFNKLPVAIGMVILAALLWDAIETLGTLIPARISSYEIVLVRYTVHLLFLLIVFGPHRSQALLQTQHPWLQVGRALMMLTMPVCFLLATRYRPLDHIWAFFWLSPALALLLTFFFLREKTGMGTWLATFLASLGIFLMIRPAAVDLNWGDLPVLGMALSFSLYLLGSRYLRSEHILASLFYTAAGVALPLSLGLPGFWVTPSPRCLLGMVAIGLLGLGLLFLLDRAVEIAPLSLLAPYLLIEPVFYLVTTCLIQHTPLSFGTILSSALTVAALTWLFFRQTRSSITGKLPVFPHGSGVK